MNTVAIVGGGITGLTAAFKLSRQNIPVTIYEAGDRVGGPVQTLKENGYLSEYGPNTILETSPKIASLICDLGLEHRRIDSNPAMNKNYVLREGKLRALPLSTGRFATSTLFSIQAKLRISCEPFIRSQPKSEDESLADFVRRRLGHEFFDYAIDPFVTGVYAGNPEDLSVRYAFPKLKALEDKYGSIILGAILGARERRKRATKERYKAKKFSFDDGLQVLPDTFRTRLHDAISLRSRVVSLRQAAAGWEVTVSVRGQEEKRLHSAVILAAPAHHIAQIQVEAEQPVNLQQLKGIVHPPVARITMGFRREDVTSSLNGFGFLAPKSENLNILGTTFSSSIFADRAPKGHVLLTTFIGGCRQPDLALEPAEKLFDFTLRDLQFVLGVRGKPTYLHHWLFRQAIPQYNVGYKQYLDFMTATENRLPGLYFAGSYRDGISVGNCIVSGCDIVDRITPYLATIEPSYSSLPVLST